MVQPIPSPHPQSRIPAAIGLRGPSRPARFGSGSSVDQECGLDLTSADFLELDLTLGAFVLP